MKIFVTFQKEGIHCYPAAPEGVEFLKHPHRHIFHFRVEIAVLHNDRDIEFIMFKRELEYLYDNFADSDRDCDDITETTLELDYKSCEMMAEELGTYIREKYPNRSLKIEISEDGENGAILEWL